MTNVRSKSGASKLREQNAGVEREVSREQMEAMLAERRPNMAGDLRAAALAGTPFTDDDGVTWRAPKVERPLPLHLRVSCEDWGQIERMVNGAMRVGAEVRVQDNAVRAARSPARRGSRATEQRTIEEFLRAAENARLIRPAPGKQWYADALAAFEAEHGPVDARVPPETTRKRFDRARKRILGQ